MMPPPAHSPTSADVRRRHRPPSSSAPPLPVALLRDTPTAAGGTNDTAATKRRGPPPSASSTSGVTGALRSAALLWLRSISRPRVPRHRRRASQLTPGGARTPRRRRSRPSRLQRRQPAPLPDRRRFDPPPPLAGRHDRPPGPVGRAGEGSLRLGLSPSPRLGVQTLGLESEHKAWNLSFSRSLRLGIQAQLRSKPEA